MSRVIKPLKLYYTETCRSPYKYNENATCKEACWLTLGVSRWSAISQFRPLHAIPRAKNTDKTLLFPLRLQISLIVYPVDLYPTVKHETINHLMPNFRSFSPSPGCERECFRAAKHETEVDGIGMCREAGGFDRALLIKPWRSTFWLYFTLLTILAR